MASFNDSMNSVRRSVPMLKRKEHKAKQYDPIVRKSRCKWLLNMNANSRAVNKESKSGSEWGWTGRHQATRKRAFTSPPTTAAATTTATVEWNVATGKKTWKDLSTLLPFIPPKNKRIEESPSASAGFALLSFDACLLRMTAVFKEIDSLRGISRSWLVLIAKKKMEIANGTNKQAFMLRFDHFANRTQAKRGMLNYSRTNYRLIVSLVDHGDWFSRLLVLV